MPATPIHLAGAARAQLLATERAAAIRLEASYRTLWQGMLPQVRAVQQALQAAAKAGRDVTAGEALRTDQATALLHSLRGGGYQFSLMAREQTAALRSYAAGVGRESSLAMLEASVPRGVAWAFATPSPRALAHLAGISDPSAPLGRLFAGWVRMRPRRRGKRS